MPSPTSHSAVSRPCAGSGSRRCRHHPRARRAASAAVGCARCLSRRSCSGCSAVEARDEGARLGELQPVEDVGTGVFVGGRRQRDARNRRVAVGQLAELQVLLAEVVAPLADAVRLVDRDQAQAATLVQRIEHRQKTRVGDPLRRGVQHHEAARQQLTLHRLRAGRVERRVEESRMHASLFERTNLVVHQRNQRADHHGDTLPGPVAGDRWHLVTQALAAAGGHQHQRVAAGNHMVDDGLLVAAELGINRRPRAAARPGRRRETSKALAAMVPAAPDALLRALRLTPVPRASAGASRAVAPA